MDEQRKCADKLVNGEVAALLGKTLCSVQLCRCRYRHRRLHIQNLNAFFSGMLFLIHPSSSPPFKQHVAEYLNSCSPCPMWRPPMMLRTTSFTFQPLLPLHLFRKFQRRIS